VYTVTHCTYLDERDTTMSPGKILAGTLIAMGTGAILGVLFAPDKGSVTRKKISKKGLRLADEVKTTAREYAGELGERIESANEIAVGLTEKVRHVADTLGSM
jgi:gas vesicle protein